MIKVPFEDRVMLIGINYSENLAERLKKNAMSLHVDTDNMRQVYQQARDGYSKLAIVDYRTIKPSRTGEYVVVDVIAYADFNRNCFQEEITDYDYRNDVYACVASRNSFYCVYRGDGQYLFNTDDVYGSNERKNEMLGEEGGKVKVTALFLAKLKDAMENAGMIDNTLDLDDIIL